MRRWTEPGRSSAVLHDRLGELAQPDAPLSWTARTPEGAGEIAQATAEALDARTAALGERLLAEPEPWVMRHLGPPPREAKPGLQAMLQADYSRRAGIAAGLPGGGRDHRSAPGHPVGRAQGEPRAGSAPARCDPRLADPRRASRPGRAWTAAS